MSVAVLAGLVIFIDLCFMSNHYYLYFYGCPQINNDEFTSFAENVSATDGVFGEI